MILAVWLSYLPSQTWSICADCNQSFKCEHEKSRFFRDHLRLAEWTWVVGISDGIANLCTHGVSDTAMCPVVCAGFNHSGALHIFWFIQATFVVLLKHAVRKLWRAKSHHPCVQICCFHAVQILESSRMPMATTDFARKEKTMVKNKIVRAGEMA